MVTAKRAGPYDYEELLKLEKGKLRKSCEVSLWIFFHYSSNF
jgi:hypothetical protein